MCIEMVSYSAGHCPAHSISVIYKIMATMASATSSCYGFTEYAGEVVSVEVEGKGGCGWRRLGGLAMSYSITVFRSSTGQSTQSPPEGKRLNKPGHVSVSPPHQQYQLCQYHYISFSSSSSPPRVDSSPGMTLPRPFNRREEGRPPTGCRLSLFFRLLISLFMPSFDST